MDVAIVTGANGLIGSEAVSFFSDHFDFVIGIDNDMRSYFFGNDASTEWRKQQLLDKYPNYRHFAENISDRAAIERIFNEFSKDIKLVIHAAAQPSHDWASKEPFVDFEVNSFGTLNMLECSRKHCPDATFIFTSTNKVYGDRPNTLPLIEQESRWEIDDQHPFYKGIDESMSIDQSKHSLFGSNKLAADIMVQEYGLYFNMNTGIFRGGCLTGPNHSGAQLHGFLSYLMKCIYLKKPYSIFGYKGKQVRDNIHSHDLVGMFWEFYKNPRKGEVYNAGGGRYSNCSMIEAIQKCEEITGNKANISISSENRIGDHIWYISDVSKFKNHYPAWSYQHDLDSILHQLFNGMDRK